MDEPEDKNEIIMDYSNEMDEESISENIEKCRDNYGTSLSSFVVGSGKYFLDNFYIFLQYAKLIPEDKLKEGLLKTLTEQKIYDINFANFISVLCAGNTYVLIETSRQLKTKNALIFV